MGLKGDFDELVSDWGKQSLLVKVMVIISFFISISSIASLSDIVFQWKGFIKDGLLFYRENIVAPIKDATSFLGLEFTDGLIDFINILVLLYFVPMVKLLWYAKRSGGLIKLDIFYIIMLIMGMILLPGVLYFNEFYWDFPLVIVMVSLIGLALIYARSMNRVIKTITPSILAVFAVLILAAINSGLTR